MCMSLNMTLVLSDSVMDGPLTINVGLLHPGLEVGSERLALPREVV